MKSKSSKTAFDCKSVYYHLARCFQLFRIILIMYQHIILLISFKSEWQLRNKDLKKQSYFKLLLNQIKNMDKNFKLASKHNKQQQKLACQYQLQDLNCFIRQRHNECFLDVDDDKKQELSEIILGFMVTLFIPFCSPIKIIQSYQIYLLQLINSSVFEHMASECPSDPDFFFTQLHRYLTQRRLTFNAFFRSLKLSNNGKITYAEFINITTRLMTALKIEGIKVGNLYSRLKSERDLIDLTRLKDKYFDSIGMNRSQSKSIETTRKSLPKDVNRSIERVKVVYEEDKDVTKAQLGLDYLIGSETVKQTLKKSLVDKYGRYKLTIEGLYHFIRYCNLKELSTAVIREKIAKKLYRILINQNQNPKGRRFYREALNIAKNLQQETNNYPKTANNYFTDRTNIQNQAQEELKVATDRIASETKVNLNDSLQSFTQKMANLAANNASSTKHRQINTSSHTFTKARVTKSPVQRESSKDTHSFVESENQLISMNDKIQQQQKEKLQSSLQRIETKQNRWVNTEQKCKMIAQSNRRNRSIGYQTPEKLKTKESALKLTMCRTDRLRSHYKSVQGTLKSSYFVSKHQFSKSIEKHTLSGRAGQNQLKSSLNKHDFRTLYPLASKYYRLKRNPTEQELPFFLELDNLLRRGAAFHDEYNPTTKYDYLRANKLLDSSKYYVISGDIPKLRADRVRRGTHSSSNLMSFLATLADKYPAYISNMFLFGANPARYYCIKVFIDGIETIIKTDDKFPSSHQRPMYASPSVNEIWTMLIEKTYAKVYNGYANICDGSLEEISSLLTGHSMITSHKTQNIEDLEQIIKAKDTGALMIGYTMEVNPSVRNKLSVTKGIDTSESYSLLDVVVNKNGEVAFKMRNPQGNNYSSKRLTHCQAIDLFYDESSPLLKKDLENGYFYLVWDDFKKYFGRVISCCFNPNYSLSTFKLQSPTKQKEYVHRFLLEIVEKGVYYISLMQPCLRRITCHYPNMVNKYSLCRLELKKSRNNPSRQHIIQAISSDKQTSLKGIQLDQGTIQLSISLRSASPTQFRGCLTFVGPNIVYAKQISLIATAER